MPERSQASTALLDFCRDRRGESLRRLRPCVDNKTRPIIMEKQVVERSTTAPNVEISLTADEALVLFECLSRFSDSGALSIVDQAEERALWNLCALFQKTLMPPFQENCLEQLKQARDRLRDDLA